MGIERDKDAEDRDCRGRFRKGRSGNPSGRPPKSRPVVLSAEEELCAELAEEITVTGPNGPTRISKRSYLIKGFINDALKATGKERMIYVERLMKMGVLKPTPEELNDNDEPTFTEADRQFLAETARELGIKPRRWNIARGRFEEED